MIVNIFWNLPISGSKNTCFFFDISIFISNTGLSIHSSGERAAAQEVLFHIPEDVKNWVSDVRNIERSGCHNCSQFNVNTTCTIAMQCNEEPELAELRNVTDMTDITV